MQGPDDAVQGQVGENGNSIAENRRKVTRVCKRVEQCERGNHFSSNYYVVLNEEYQGSSETNKMELYLGGEEVKFGEG